MRGKTNFRERRVRGRREDADRRSPGSSGAHASSRKHDVALSVFSLTQLPSTLDRTPLRPSFPLAPRPSVATLHHPFHSSLLSISGKSRFSRLLLPPAPSRSFHLSTTPPMPLSRRVIDISVCSFTLALPSYEHHIQRACSLDR